MNATKDRRQSAADRRLSDAKERAAWSAAQIKDTRSPNVIRAVQRESEYFDQLEKQGNSSGRDQ